MNVNSAALVLAVLVFAAPSLAQERRYYFKEERPLRYDTSRIAIQAADKSAVQLARELEAHGVAPVHMEPMVIDGWWFASLPASSTNETAIRAAIHRLAREAAVDFVAPVFADDRGDPIVPTREILMAFENGLARAEQQRVLDESAAGDVLDRDYAQISGAFRTRSRSRDGLEVLAAANALALRAEVKLAEPNMICIGRSSHVPNDPLFPQCWALDNQGQSGGVADVDMNAPEAWDMTLGSASVIVVILDTGVQQNHPDLHQIPGADTTSEGPGNGGPTNACDNHGTSVAGCVSAIVDNALGTVGIAPGVVCASVRMGIDVLPCANGFATQATWVIDGLTFAETIGARVTNNSNRYGFTSAALALKYQQTHDEGIVHFASAGNDAAPSVWSPASLPSVNAVAAIDRTGALASFSNHGSGLAFCAPGVDVVTTDRTGADGYGPGDYRTTSGTSYASPYAAGVAALVVSAHPELNATQVEQVLAQSARDLGASGYDLTFGWGLVDARAALLRASSLAATIPLSVTSAGQAAAGDSSRPKISDGGDMTVFLCSDKDLAPNGVVAQNDVYARWWRTNTTARVSVASSGAQANAPSMQPAISSNGVYVVFTSAATNLTTTSTGGHDQVFLRDSSVPQTYLVTSSSGFAANAGCYDAMVSATGQRVTFDSAATNLTVPPGNGQSQIYFRDPMSPTVLSIASVDDASVQGNGASVNRGLSDDARFVLFESDATNLVAGDTNGVRDVFVRDRTLGTTRRVSVSTSGVEADASSSGADISADGRFVVFASDATNLVANDAHGQNGGGIFLRDLTAATTVRVNVNWQGYVPNGSASGCSISADGRFVAFVSGATDLVASDTNGMSDVFVRDLVLGHNVLASVSSSGVQANGSNLAPSIAKDGRFVAFASVASNLTAGDVNGLQDVFLRDMGALSAMNAFCFGDGVEIQCPCGNNGVASHGCQNSAATGGAILSTSGVAKLSLDTLQFTSSGELSSALSIFLQGTANVAPYSIFGQGVRCIGGVLKRLYSESAASGVAIAPASGDLSVHARSMALGDTIAGGSTRYYQTYYRDPHVLGGCPSASTFNVSQAVAVSWLP